MRKRGKQSGVRRGGDRNVQAENISKTISEGGGGGGREHVCGRY